MEGTNWIPGPARSFDPVGIAFIPSYGLWRRACAGSVKHGDDAAIENYLAADRGPIMDINLVMNAINQIAARDGRKARAAHPLLFALSDYLHGALSALPDRSVRRQLELAGAHASLYAGVQRCSLALSVVNCPHATVTIRRGLFSEIVLCLLRHVKLEPGDRWKVRLCFDSTIGADNSLGFSLALITRSQRALIDRQALLDALARSPGVTSGYVAIDPATPLNQSKFMVAGFRLRVARC